MLVATSGHDQRRMGLFRREWVRLFHTVVVVVTRRRRRRRSHTCVRLLRL